MAHAPDAPRTMLHGRMLRCRRDRALEGDDTVPRADLDGGCMDGGISIENQAHGIADGIVAIFLGGWTPRVSITSRVPETHQARAPASRFWARLGTSPAGVTTPRVIATSIRPTLVNGAWTILNCPRMCSRIVHPVSAGSSTKALRKRS